MRLCVIGDELVAGTGDSRSLGWIGRVCARSRFKVPATVMALAMPGAFAQVASSGAPSAPKAAWSALSR